MIKEIFDYIFSLKFLPHGHCFLGDDFSLWLNILGNFGIFLAYMLIPLGLSLILKQQQKQALKSHKTILILFMMFIFSCGITHLFDIIVIWWPCYRLQTYWAIWTASISLSTGFILIPYAKEIRITAYKLFKNKVEITEIELPPKNLKP